MDRQKIFSVIDEMNGRYCDIWEEVCNIESPTVHKAGVDEVGNYFVNMANERGWSVEVMEHAVAGNAICITINPDAKKAPVVFSGHIDTVHPIGLFGTPAVRRDETCIYGPGVMDCKGGVVASFMALDALARCDFKERPVKLIIQSDEETNSKQSNKQTVAFMVEKAKGAAAFLNTEGIQGNTLVWERKGILRYRYTVTGKAMHSSRCAEGANAIAEAAYKIIELEKVKDPSGLTFNCGVIEGGTVANTVPEKCSFVVDIRFSNEEQYNEAVRIVERVAETVTVAGCTTKIEQVSVRPAMPFVDRNVALAEVMNKIYERCGLPLLTGRSCLSGSDAAYTTGAGIPTVDNIGVDGGRIHSIDEFAYLDSLAACAKRLAAVACYL